MTKRVSTHTFAIALGALVLILTGVPDAHAELTLKKLIIRDCTQAKLELAKSPPEDKSDLVSFLSLLLKQRPTRPVETVIDTSNQISKKSGPFDSPLEDSKSGDLWRLFDPGHESAAKQCALDLLPQLLPESFAAVPSIIELSGDLSANDAVRDRLAATMLSLTKSTVSNGAIEPDSSVIRSAIEGLSKPYSPFAKNFLIELGARGVPPLLAEMRKPDAQRRDMIAGLLMQIDSDGALIGPGVAGLLSSGDDGLRKRALEILGKLPGYLQQTLPLLLGALNDLSEEVKNQAAETLASLSKEALSSYAGLSEVTKGAVTAFLVSPDTRRASLQKFLAKAVLITPEADKLILPLIASHSPELIKQGMALLEDLPLSSETTSLLSELAAGPDEDVSAKAFIVLSKQQGKRGQAVEVVKKVIKTRIWDSKSTPGQGYLRAIATALLNLDAVGETKKLLPLFIKSLPRRQDITSTSIQDDAIARLIIRNGKEAVPLLLTASRDQDPQKSVSAIEILALIAPSDPKVIQQALLLLKGSDLQIRRGAEELLSRSGEAAVPHLKKLLKVQNTPARYSAARILAGRGVGESSVQSVLLEGVAAEDCSRRGEIIQLISKFNTTLSAQVVQPLLACAKQRQLDPEKFLAALTSLIPLSQEIRLSLLEMARAESTDKVLKLRILEGWKVLELPLGDVSAILVDMVQTSDNSLKYAALNLLRAMGSAASSVAPKLLEIAIESELEPLLQHEAIIALIEIDPTAFDFTSFFVKELKGDHAEWAIRSMRRLEASQVGIILDKAFDSLSAEAKLPVIRLMGDLPKEQATLFVPRLLGLLDSLIPELRFAVLVALLRIDPMRPELLEPLRSTLIDSQRANLLRETFSASLRPLLEQQLPKAASRVEQLGLETLLKRTL